MQIRPGLKPKTFIDNCVKEMDDCILDTLSDGEALIAGVLVPEVIFDVENEKMGFGDGPQQEGETITVYWLKKYQDNVRSGDPVVFNNESYSVKPGYPLDIRDCWLMAELWSCK